jgi:hypothetical protein
LLLPWPDASLQRQWPIQVRPVSGAARLRRPAFDLRDGWTDGTVRVWDLTGTTPPRVFTGHDNMVMVMVMAVARMVVSWIRA